MSECKHGLEASTCAECTGTPAASGKPVVTVAKFESTCPVCDERIRLGTRIVLVDDDWIQEGCLS